MRQATKTFSLILIFLLLLSSCTTIHIRSNSHYPISMSSRISDDYTVVGHFSVKTRAMFTLGGFLTFKDVDFDYLVNHEIARYGGDGAVNVRIVDQMNGTDILINMGLSAAGGLIGYAITGSSEGIWGSILPFFLSTRTVTVKGDVIRRVRL